MTTLTLTNVSHDLASLEMAGRLVYIERRARRLRVYTLAGSIRTVGLAGTPAQAVTMAVKELESMSAIPDRITPELVRRACDALAARGCTIERHKTDAAALGTDPVQAPAYTVRRGRQVVGQAISARRLVELAAEAAGEVDGE